MEFLFFSWLHVELFANFSLPWCNNHVRRGLYFLGYELNRKKGTNSVALGGAFCPLAVHCLHLGGYAVGWLWLMTTWAAIVVHLAAWLTLFFRCHRTIFKCLRWGEVFIEFSARLSSWPRCFRSCLLRTDHIWKEWVLSFIKRLLQFHSSLVERDWLTSIYCLQMAAYFWVRGIF